MGARQFTGLVTQRSPYRDGAVPYLVGKFYGGTRFDSIWDGINREISQRLTDQRAPGSSVYNSNTFPACNSFGVWKYIQNGAEIVRVLYDGADGTLYDATAGQKSILFAKSAGAGAARFCSVNTELFLSDGVDQKKVLRSGKTWSAATSYNIGDFIIDPNGNIQSVQANPVSYTIADVAVVEIQSYGYLVLTFAAAAPAMNSNQTCSFSGLTTYTSLNGTTLTWREINPNALQQLALTANQIAFPLSSFSIYGPAADTGTMVARVLLPGTTGATQPAWSATFGAVTNDGGTNGGVNWTCFGSQVENWGIAPVPYAAPSYLGPATFVSAFGRYWGMAISLPFASMPRTVTFSILDPNGNVQVTTFTYTGSGPSRLGGLVFPSWSGTLGTYTADANFTWLNYGSIASSWYAATSYGGYNSTTEVSNACVVLDSNGNLQGVQSLTTAGVSGSTVPAWATTTGATTTDNTVTWVCLGPGSVLWSGTYQYSLSFVGIDGSVSTAAPVTLVPNGGLGPNGSFQMDLSFNLAGTAAVTDKQVAQIVLWRTAQGQSTLIELDQVPNPFLLGSTTLSYRDVSTDLQLNAFIPAPVAEAAQPPQAAMTAPAYYQQRVWGIVANTVVYSGGPDTVTGNGNTAWPPLNEIPFAAQPVKLIPVLVQNGGLVVMTTSGVKIILGTGTPSNPYYVGDYLELVSVLGYNAVSVFYNQIFCMESNGKVSALAIEYPFNPQTGYTEVGFPIGDQFVKTTTGGQNAALFNPATAYVSWNAFSSADTGMYVSDGAGHWFRMSLINPPESGILWSPLRTLQGGASAVQSVETAPGVHNLLIAPATGTTGPILMRDTTGAVWTDVVAGTPTAYPAWDAKGVTKLCTTGQWATIKHVSAKSVNTGGPRPSVGLLFNEIRPSATRPYLVLAPKGISNDPPRNLPSLSVYSDRYRTKDGQPMETTGDCVLVKFDYGVQAFGDELLDWELYGKVTQEDEEQAAKA
jgi:hypothetical protein